MEKFKNAEIAGSLRWVSLVSIHLCPAGDDLLCKFTADLVDAGLESALIKQIEGMFSSPVYDNISQQLASALPEMSIVSVPLCKCTNLRSCSACA